MLVGGAILIVIRSAERSSQKSHVVLGQARLGSARADEVIEFRALDAAPEGILLGEGVEKRGHPPRETFDLPHPLEHAGRVVVDPGLGALFVYLAESVGEATDVVGREIEPLGPGGRDDMGRIAGQEQRAEAQRLGHETAQWRHRLLRGGAGRQDRRRFRVEPPAQLVPEAVVRPVGDPLGRRDLDIVAAARGRPHGAECEAPRVVGVDQFVRYRRALDQHPEPAERVDAFEDAERIARDGATRDP